MELTGTFNVMAIMLDGARFMLVGIALLLAMTLSLRRDRSSADLLLAAFILIQSCLEVYAVILFGTVTSGATVDFMHSFASGPVIALYGLQGPVLLWYSHSMSSDKFQPARSDVIIIVTFVSLALLSGWLSLRLIFLISLISLLVSITYGIRALREVHGHEHEIRQRYSNIDGRQLLWLASAAFGFIGVWALRAGTLAAALLSRDHLAEFISNLSDIPVMILICWMIVIGLLRRPASNGRRASQAIARSHEDVCKTANPDHLERLENLMVTVKVYQDPDLHLEDLADSMGISTRSLSALINSHFEQNYYDFVNHYRAIDAQRQLEDPELASKTVQRIFEDAGFSSKSTFNTFFKKVTGKTPSEYRHAALSASGPGSLNKEFSQSVTSRKRWSLRV